MDYSLNSGELLIFFSFVALLALGGNLFAMVVTWLRLRRKERQEYKNEP